MENELRKAKEIINAVYSLYDIQSSQTDILVDFIEQNGLDDKLMVHMKEIEKNEKMPSYRNAAKEFNEITVMDDVFIINNYRENKEISEERSDFLLEPTEPLVNVNKEIDLGKLPINVHDKLNGF